MKTDSSDAFSNVEQQTCNENNNVLLPYKDVLRCLDQDNLILTRTQLLTQVNDFAAGLISLQFDLQSKVALLLPNSAEHLVIQLAAAKAGITLVEMDSKIKTAEEIAFVLKDSNCRALMYEPKMNGVNYHPIIRQVLPELEYADAKAGTNGETLRANAFPNLVLVMTTGIGHENFPGVFQFRHMFVNAMDARELSARFEQVTDDTPLVISYEACENGGMPKKGPMKTHSDLLSEIQNLNKTLKISASDSLCLSEPPVGLSAGVFACLQHSAQIVLPSMEYDEAKTQRAIELESCDLLLSGNTLKRL